jgi:glycerophosphoryl diester phosphodiesterase
MARTKLLTDAVYSPTIAASEEAIRSQIDGSIQEVYDIVDEAKLDKTSGDYTGSWHGVAKPVYAEPGLAGVVDALDASLTAHKAENVTQFATKVDKVAGKGLSTNDYNNTEKAEVAKVVNKADKTEVNILATAKADKTYVDTLTASLASGSPKGTYATVAALTTAIPAGNTSIYVVAADGKWYYWNGAAWAPGGNYQGIGILEGSVSRKELSNEIKNVMNEYLTIGAEWELGHVATSGALASSTTRIRTNMLLLKAGTIIQLTDTVTYSYAYNLYNLGDQSHQYNSGYKIRKTILKEDAYCIVFMKKKDDSVLTDIIDAVASNLLIYEPNSLLNLNSEKIKDNAINTRTLNFELQKYLLSGFDWDYGRYDVGVMAFATNRIATFLFKIDSPTIIELQNDTYNYSVLKFTTEGTLLIDSGWVTSPRYLGDTDSQYALVIRQTDDADILDVKTASEAIKVFSTYTLVNIYDRLKNKDIYVFGLDWENGSVSTSGDLTTTDTRIRTKKVFLKAGTMIYLNDYENYRIILQKYAEDGIALQNYPSDYGKRFIDEDGTYIIVMKKIDDSILDPLIESSRVSVILSGTKLREVPNTITAIVKAIAHRGYNKTAPENTLPAYTLAKQKGFSYAESDVRFTVDGFPVMSHVDTIDGFSSGTGTISTMTLAELKLLDFGSWKDPRYAGTTIPTFEEFMLHCKKLNLHPYIHIKSGTVEQVGGLCTSVKRLGMNKSTTWLVESSLLAQKLIETDVKARIGWLIQTAITSDTIQTVNAFKTGENEVFVDIEYSVLTAESSNLCLDADIGLECWIVDDEDTLISLSELGVTGVTTDYLNVAEILAR